MCSRCGAILRYPAVPMSRDGVDVVLGVDCGCYGRWLHWREFREFEDSGLVQSGRAD